MKNILKNLETLGATFAAFKDDISMEHRLDEVDFKFKFKISNNFIDR